MLPLVDIKTTERLEVERAITDLRDAMQRELDETTKEVTLLKNRVVVLEGLS